jgi:hypothetical protein
MWFSSAGILPAVVRAARPFHFAQARLPAATLPVLAALLTLFPRASSKDTVPPQVSTVKQGYLADDGRALWLSAFAQDGLPVAPSKKKFEEDSRV